MKPSDISILQVLRAIGTCLAFIAAVCILACTGAMLFIGLDGLLWSLFGGLH